MISGFPSLQLFSNSSSNFGPQRHSLQPRDLLSLVWSGCLEGKDRAHFQAPLSVGFSLSNEQDRTPSLGESSQSIKVGIWNLGFFFCLDILFHTEISEMQ